MSGLRAVCTRCGADKPAFDRVCGACGHRPDGDGLLVAWLVSDQFLPSSQLPAVAERVKRGEVIRPSLRQLDRARRALGRHFASDAGLDVRQRRLLLAANLALTPLVGWTLWLWWRDERPTASWQALWLTWPASILGFVAVVAVRVGWL